MSGDGPSIAARLGELVASLAERHRRSRRRRDALRDYPWALANIKMLGYELARLTAGTQLSPPPVAPLEVGLASKACTQADIESAWFAFWCSELNFRPVYVRKIWETCYAAQALWERAMLAPGHRGIGFGVGREALPSLFAKYGCEILASDLPAASARARVWRGTRQHAQESEVLRDPAICPDPAALERISFRAIDMARIPGDLDERFDFCWSCCALEHLGSLGRGAEFIENSLRVLKPGGVAVHTTELNLSQTGETIGHGSTVLFQRRHIEDIAGRLSRAGHSVAPLDFAAGDGMLDGFVDLPPFDPAILRTTPHPAHLRVSVEGFRCTSFGLIVRRAA